MEKENKSLDISLRIDVVTELNDSLVRQFVKEYVERSLPTGRIGHLPVKVKSVGVKRIRARR
jgi:hypothetical protein